MWLLPERKPTGERIHIAVASNFTGAMEPLAQRFEAMTGYEVVISSGSTGLLYAQIRNGAPFDALFAADKDRPARLVADGYALPGSRFTYAVGRLALWSPRVGVVESDGNLCDSKRLRHMAIANPQLAPYGKAARAVLQARGLWKTLEKKRVMGQNIAQTYQFVESGHADVGFVAYSQLRRAGHTADGADGSYWLVPESMHSPIAQQAVVLNDGAGVSAWMDFIMSDEAQEMIRSFGYGTQLDTGSAPNIESGADIKKR
ncbi:MAG: molybdate ABC transporter substrate-binding protein [Verrucomicrobiae bacterium]|nr:molybdate ABC transporter substrate-binding protein [Verrucomicrobiae bacterium]NNJ42863.1 molybdate ABC transporter substrate-binding protein [Akkermansiaceae bacterium]